MAKKVLTTIKLQARAGQASPAPPVGPALGQHGINIMEFCKSFNAQTQSETGTIVPVVITVYEDRSFTFVTKTPPAAVLIREALRLEKGSGEPHRKKVGKLTARAAGGDRRAQAARPQRPRRRARLAHHRRHRPLDGGRCGGAGVSTHHSRRHAEARAKVDREREYQPAEAIALVKEPRRRQVRRVGRGAHPHRAQRPPRRRAAARHDRAAPRPRASDVKVAVFAQGAKVAEAEAAGADVVGAEDLAQRIQEGFDEFDVAIATPDLMSVVGRLGRILGPSGKMPNPKVGTVTMDVAKRRHGVQGRQGRVPHRPHRDRPPRDRQGLLRGARAARELRRRHRRADPRQAVGRQRPLPAHDHARLDDGARRESRPFPYPRHR